MNSQEYIENSYKIIQNFPKWHCDFPKNRWKSNLELHRKATERARASLPELERMAKAGFHKSRAAKRCLPRNFWWGKKPEELSNIFQYRTKCEGQFADCGVFAFREMMNWWSCSPRSGLRRKFLIRLGLQYVISIGGGFVYHYDPLHVDLMMFVDEMFQLDFDVLLPTAISYSSEASYK